MDAPPSRRRRSRSIAQAQCIRGQPRLSAEQQIQSLEWLREGAHASGFRGDLWTKTRVAVLTERKLSIHYHSGHLSKLRQAWGWISQKPEQRARQRDEVALDQWVKERWPAIRKQAVEEERTLLFLDESGFYALPSVVRTYAPVGDTPILHHTLSHDHLSVIGAVGL